MWRGKKKEKPMFNRTRCSCPSLPPPPPPPPQLSPRPGPGGSPSRSPGSVRVLPPSRQAAPASPPSISPLSPSDCAWQSSAVLCVCVCVCVRARRFRTLRMLREAKVQKKKQRQEEKKVVSLKALGSPLGETVKVRLRRVFLLHNSASIDTKNKATLKDNAMVRCLSSFHIT